MEILIVEDDDVTRKILQTILLKEGHEVICASNGKQGWNLFTDSRVRLVITDWMLPEMHGIELCRKIREAALSYYTYIILVTAKDGRSDMVTGFDAGVDDYIVKPFTASELKSRIRSALRIINLENRYKETTTRLIQKEKMASIGQLAAGVAHEINNPIGFVSSNLKTLSDYQSDLTGIYSRYRDLLDLIKSGGNLTSCGEDVSVCIDEIEKFEEEIDIQFIVRDMIELIADCRDGTDRIRRIVSDLKDFAHPGEECMQEADINGCIDTTLNVIANEIRPKASVIRNYAQLPTVTCYPQQLNQVFMNIILNAAQAIEEKGEINITTSKKNGNIEVEIRDTGPGISQENISKIFDPFYTTMEVGKGMGLGMHVAYNIIKKHNGEIAVENAPGSGATFRVRIPVGQEPPR